MKKRKMLGRLLFPKILEVVNHDLDNTVFSYIPNTAETSFWTYSGGRNLFKPEERITDTKRREQPNS